MASSSQSDKTMFNQIFLKAHKMLKISTKSSVSSRLVALHNVISRILQKNGIEQRFNLDESVAISIFDSIERDIDNYAGPKPNPEKYKTVQDLNQVCRTWWNRVKPAKLANILFLKVMYKECFTFVMNIKFQSPCTKLILFIDIFIGTMYELIKFPRAKPKPLIPHQCLLIQSHFKDICCLFIKHFGTDIKWNGVVNRVGAENIGGRKIYKYIKDGHRSKNLFNTYAETLVLLKNELTEQNKKQHQSHIQNLIHSFMEQYAEVYENSIRLFNNKPSLSFITSSSSLSNNNYTPPSLNINNNNSMNMNIANVDPPILPPINHQQCITCCTSYGGIHGQSNINYRVEQSRHSPLQCTTTRTRTSNNNINQYNNQYNNQYDSLCNMQSHFYCNCNKSDINLTSTPSERQDHYTYHQPQQLQPTNINVSSCNEYNYNTPSIASTPSYISNNNNSINRYYDFSDSTSTFANIFCQ